VTSGWTWATLAALGAYHGVNPAMGWLFAVGLGLQQRSRASVLRALAPIAVGHAASVALVVAAVRGAETVVPPRTLALVGAAALVAFGVFKLVKPLAHPRWVGMRVTRGDLVVWSFLMSTAHGAGLMLFPLLVHAPAGGTAGHVLAEVAVDGGAGADLAAMAVHTASMLVVMGAVAVVVYERLGVAILRRAWINLDVVWSVAIVGAGLLALFI
jgi:hypothetical protein